MSDRYHDRYDDHFDDDYEDGYEAAYDDYDQDEDDRDGAFEDEKTPVPSGRRRASASVMPAGYGDPTGWPVVGDPGFRRRPGSPGGGPDRRSPNRGPSRRRGGFRAHPVLTFLAVLVVLIVVLVGGGLLWVQSQIDPGGKRGPQVTVVIPTGSSTRQIGSLLAGKGIIHNGTLFAYYVRLHGDGPLLPGTYTLDRNLPYTAVISALEKGPVIVTEALVVPEGFTVAQIAARVAELPHFGLSAQKFMAAANSGAVRSPYEPPGVNNLEGLLYPATYQIRQGMTEVQILSELVGQFNGQAHAFGLDAAAQRLGMTPYQVVTVASIVEKEAKLTGDRGPVASTIYNRLRDHMTLGADSTQTYWLRLSDPGLGVPTAAQDELPSPYNTRLNPGLPPTPIANPGMASLQAAIAPPVTTYLYFVEINSNGQLGFASDSAGFDHLQQQCRAAQLC